MLSRLLLPMALAGLVACPAPPPPPVLPEAPARSGKITGRVELEPGGSPAGVVVKLVLNDGSEPDHHSPRRMPNVLLRPGGALSHSVLAMLRGSGLRSQTTDASGAFAFDGLEPGRYFVDLRIKGSALGSVELDEELTLTNIRVTPGTSNDLGVVTLRKSVHPMDLHAGHETY